MNEHETNGHRSQQDLEQENARLRRELSQARERQRRDRDAICKLLAGGGVISDEDVRRMIAEGSPYLDQLKEIEQEMLDSIRDYQETAANPIPFQEVLDDLERLMGADYAK